MATGEDYLDVVKESREGAAVLKMDLINLRNDLPDDAILVFEGDDDKAAYYQWIQRLSPGLSYEPFPCRGKEKVLQLKAVLDRDLSGLGDCVFFFVDRDFDDLRGETPDPERLFMTVQYSIENCLVTPRVLERVLTNEFHCHARPMIRASVLERFGQLLDDFLGVTRAVNFRIYCARRVGVEIRPAIPDKISKIVSVALTEVGAGSGTADQIIKYARELEAEELAGLQEQFDLLDPRERFRGKFMLGFFLKWLEVLAVDRTSADSICFPDLRKDVKIRLQGLTIENLASKSEPPEGLFEFIQGVERALTRRRAA